MNLRFIHFILSFALIGFSLKVLSADKEADKGTTPTYRFSGDAQLLSHFIDRGLSITNGNPALNASFLFNMGQQFRVGFWGSNVSNVSATDDNLWLKVVADVHIDFSKDSIFKMYFNDDHFYKSDIRNGQSVGITYDYTSYIAQLEWMSNFQGTKTDALYFKFGKMYYFYKEILTGFSGGYILQKSPQYSDYMDLKAVSTYKVSDFFELEAAITMTLNGTQFRDRGNFGIYAGLRLSY